MKRFLLIAASFAILIGLAVAVQPLKAQVFDEYGTTTVERGVPYEELASKVVIPASKFAMPPNFIQNTARGRDDGFYKVNMPFSFEFNGEIYSSLWICVNGYVMFTEAGGTPPQTLPTKNGTMKLSDWFFYYNSSYPNNVVAPFMGDHFYRTGDDNPTPWPGANQYVTSEISYGSTDLDNDGEVDVFTIQWKNLNINYDDPLNIVPTAGITSSVGNFQVKFYRSQDPWSKEGDIQFAYGLVNINNPQTNDTRVITQGAAVGVKGNSGQDGQLADFLNGLYNYRPWVDDIKDYDKDESKTSIQTTTFWQPSGGTDYRVRYIALGRHQKEEFWGDGDVDLSQVEGQKHGGMPQNRFVTVGDARKIIRSIVTNHQLPRERRREAYHGDVNHNGRYFYFQDHNYYLGWNNDGTIRNVFPKDTVFKVDLTWRNMYYGDSLAYILHDVWNPVTTSWHYDAVVPSQISSLSQVYFQVTEKDASYILLYIAGRLTQLPYLIDSIVQKGKIIPNELYANGINVGEVVSLGQNLYNIAIYANGKSVGPLGLKLNVNGEIVNASCIPEITSGYENNTLVLASNDNFDGTKPMCVVTVKTNDNQIEFSNIRFNDNELGSIVRNLTSVENTNNDELLLQNTPNPFTENTVISINVKDDDNYTLNIYDTQGNVVKTYNDISNGNIIWDGTNDNGQTVQSGMYIYRLTGNNLSIAKKLVFVK